MCWGDVQLCRNFHMAGVPRIQWKKNQNSFKKRSIALKMFAVPNNQECPVKAYKVYAESDPRSITRYSTVSQKQQLNMKSHSHWNEFGRNSSPVWLFYSGEKEARVWRTHLSNISSNLFSVKQASSTAAPFSFLGCCYKRRTYRCGNKHYKSIAHTFSVRGKP